MPSLLYALAAGSLFCPFASEQSGTEDEATQPLQRAIVKLAENVYARCKPALNTFFSDDRAAFGVARVVLDGPRPTMTIDRDKDRVIYWITRHEDDASVFTGLVLRNGYIPIPISGRIIPR